MKFRKHAVALALTAGFVVGGQAQAVLIDDFDFTAVPANGQATSGTNGAVGADSRGTGGSGAWVDGSGNRIGQLYVNEVFGDPGMQTQDCPNCNAAHAVNPSSSAGHHYWYWEGPDLSVNSVSFDYETDIDNGDFFITLFNDGAIVAQEQWMDVSATGLTATPPPLLLSQPLTIDYSGIIDAVRIDLLSVGNVDAYSDPTNVLSFTTLGERAIGLDANIDNLRYHQTPEPSTLALLGLGLAGIGWQRRRKPNV